MQKEILQNILTQNQITCSFAFNALSNENAEFRLNEETASAGFIYRHIGETINLFGMFFGVPTDVNNTTIGEYDCGQGQNITESKDLIEKGFEMLQRLVENTLDEVWLETVETPFFSTIPKIRLFSHVLFHTSHHAGQISLSLARGRKF